MPPEPQEKPNSGPEARTVPLGPPLDWSDEDLDALSEITPQDVENSRGWVNRHATERGKALWSAAPDEGDAT